MSASSAILHGTISVSSRVFLLVILLYFGGLPSPSSSLCLFGKDRSGKSGAFAGSVCEDLFTFFGNGVGVDDLLLLLPSEVSCDPLGLEATGSGEAPQPFGFTGVPNTSGAGGRR